MPTTLLRINNSNVPAYARPQRLRVEYPEPATTNLLGEPGGAQGYPRLVLEWDRIAGRALRWWQAFVRAGRESVRLTYVLAPDPRATTTVVIGAASYPNHASWRSGILHRPRVDASATVRWYHEADGTERDYYEGRVTVVISELGRPF